MLEMRKWIRTFDKLKNEGVLILFSEHLIGIDDFHIPTVTIKEYSRIFRPIRWFLQTIFQSGVVNKN